MKSRKEHRMDGNFVVAVSIISSVISIAIGIFGVFLSPKKEANAPIAKNSEIEITNSEDVRSMLEALKNGETVNFQPQHIETVQVQNFSYKYSNVRHKESGKSLVSSI